MLNAHFYQKTLFLTQISKRSTPTDLHHPDLHLAQFFSLESLKTSSAYAKTSLGPKMEKFLQTSMLCGILQNWSLYPHTCIPMVLRHNDPWVESHMQPNRCGVKCYLGVNDLWFMFLKKGSLYPHTLMFFHGTWTQWSLGRVTHVTSTDLGSKVM